MKTALLLTQKLAINSVLKLILYIKQVKSALVLLLFYSVNLHRQNQGYRRNHGDHRLINYIMSRSTNTVLITLTKEPLTLEKLIIKFSTTVKSVRFYSQAKVST